MRNLRGRNYQENVQLSLGLYDRGMISRKALFSVIGDLETLYKSKNGLQMVLQLSDRVIIDKKQMKKVLRLKKKDAGWIYGDKAQK